jgi:hypothetical protein
MLSSAPVQVPAVTLGAEVEIVMGSVTLVTVLLASVTLNVTLVAASAAMGVPVIMPVLLMLSVEGRAHGEGQLHV